MTFLVRITNRSLTFVKHHSDNFYQSQNLCYRVFLHTSLHNGARSATDGLLTNTSNANTSLLRPSLNQQQQHPVQSALQARINQKRLELQNLQQLRDLSANLTEQLETLESKLSNLRDGAQSVALVLANWDNVLNVIRMAGMKVPDPMPKASAEVDGGENGEGGHAQDDGEVGKEQQELPVPLVRIPVQAKTTDDG